MNYTELIHNKVLYQNTDNIILFLENYKDAYIDWKKYINSVLDTKSDSFNKISERIGFSKNTLRKWCVNGEMPQNRNAFIKLAFGLNLSIDDTNELLSKYGGCSVLYAKDINDAIVIYILSRHNAEPDNTNYNFDSLKKWRLKYETLVQKRNIDDSMLYNRETIGFYNELKCIREEDEFEKFIKLNQLVFFSSYSKLLKYIEEFISIRISEEELLSDGEKYSFHKLMYGRKNGAKLEKMMSKLKNYGIVPERKYLIAMGIFLNMTLFEINKMLKLANMQTLYARDKFDCIMICVIYRAMLADPDLSLNNALKMSRFTHNREWKREFEKIVSDYTQVDDSDITDNYIEKLSDFITQKLMEIDNKSSEVIEILELLE